MRCSPASSPFRASTGAASPPSTWTSTWDSAPDHPASFRRYLNEHLFRLVGLPAESVHLIPGEATERPLQTCLDYEAQLLAEPPDIVCAGIGENGHLAFNDPPVADFLDPVHIKVVRLDELCRKQQVNDGCFDQLADVPTHAYTLTVPALLKAPELFVVVPGTRKANAVLGTLRGPIQESCPASALRNHPARFFTWIVTQRAASCKLTQTWTKQASSLGPLVKRGRTVSGISGLQVEDLLGDSPMRPMPRCPWPGSHTAGPEPPSIPGTGR